MKPDRQTQLLERAAWALLCLFVFSIPWEKSVWVPGIGSIAKAAGIIAFIAGAAAALRRRSIRRPNIAMIFAALLVFWSVLTYVWSLDRSATLSRAATFVQLLAMLWLVWDLCRGPVRQRQIMGAYLFGAVAASSIAFARFFLGQQTYYRRYAATGFTPNDFGLVLALSIPLGLYLALTGRGRMRWCYRAAILISVTAIILTASRAAMISTFIAFAFVPLMWCRAEFSQKIAAAVMLGFLVFGIFHGAPAPSRQRLATLPGELKKGTFHGRTQIWKSGVRALKQHPVLGVGSGAYPEAVVPWLGRSEIAGFQNVAHNTFLSVLVECGPVGFAFFAILLGLLVLYVWMMPPPEQALWAVMLVVWAAGVSTLTWEHYKPTWLLFALIMTEWARSCWHSQDSE